MSLIIENFKDKTIRKNKEIKTCLVVQGGGMRASYSMGALLALEDLGYRDSFDYIIGSSAGAINGAYFLAGQSRLASQIYVENLTNNNFLNYFRLNEVLSVDYMIDLFSNGKTAIDLDKIVRSNTSLQFSMIHYPSAQEFFFDSKEHSNDLISLIKASATIPAISNKKVIIDGEKYIDGAVVDPIAIHRAIDLGCTDIIVVLTRSKNFRRKSSRFVYNSLSRTYFKDWPKESRDALFEQFSKVNDIYDFVWAHEGKDNDFRLTVIAPSDDNMAGLLSKNKNKIAENINRGYDDMRRVMV
jgi:predicted patatin/cPLA2 family phospholipase